MDVLLELLVIVVLVLLNGLLAMAETALVSSRKARLQKYLDEGDKRAPRTLALIDNPNTFLSAVQIGITLVGVVAGAFGGATLAGHLVGPLEPWLGASAQPVAFALVVVMITVLSLVIGELIPKRLALGDPEATALKVTPLMSGLTRTMGPFVRLLELASDLVLKLLGLKLPDEIEVSEDEIRYLVREARRTGVIEEREQAMLESIFVFGDRVVASLMTPRNDLEWLDVKRPLEQIMAQVDASARSRFLVCKGSLEKILGIVRAKELLAEIHTNHSFDWKEVISKPLFVPESMKALTLLESFRSSGTHLAVVVDEYGEVIGLVTLTDVLEAIVGEIPMNDDPEDEPEVTQRDDGSYLLDGSLSIEEFKDLFDLRELPDEDPVTYQTLGGLVMSQRDHIPTAGEKFVIAGLEIEVMDMDFHRVDKVLVRRVESESAGLDEGGEETA